MVKIEHSWVSGINIIMSLDKKTDINVSVKNNGDISHEIIYNDKYAPIIENKGEFVTQEEYWRDTIV